DGEVIQGRGDAAGDDERPGIARTAGGAAAFDRDGGPRAVDRHVLGKRQCPVAALGSAQVDRATEAGLELDGVAGLGGGEGLPQRQEVVIRGGLIQGRRDRQGRGGQPVLDRLQQRPEPGRCLAAGAGRGGEQGVDAGASGDGKPPPGVVWSAVAWEGNDPGAQTGRPGAVGPVGGLLGGTTPPAAFLVTRTVKSAAEPATSEG